MLAAVQPVSLREKIANRMQTARAPDGDDDELEGWRLDARKDPEKMYELIHENAKHADKMRQMGRKTITETPPNYNEVCRNSQHGRCTLGEKCRRKHVNADGTVVPTRGHAGDNTSTATGTADGNTNNGNPNAQQKPGKSAGDSDDKQGDCWHWTNGNTCLRGDACHYKHDPAKFNTTTPPRRNPTRVPTGANASGRSSNGGGTSNGGGATGDGNTRSGAGRSGNSMSHGQHATHGTNGNPSNMGNTAVPGAAAAKTCVICGGNHVFFDSCPKKEKVGRILRTANINYAHTARWWKVASNIQKMKDWRAANPRMFMQQQRSLRFCGEFQAFGNTYETDIDLGGDFNIAPEAEYERILQRQRNGETQMQTIRKVNKRETVELANGDHVVIDKWLATKLTGNSITSRHTTVYDVEFGFAQACPGRLIIGPITSVLKTLNNSG